MCPNIDPRSLEETGRLHFFYHSPDSHFPIRDVRDSQGRGRKTEPYIEKQAENYCVPCLQSNIRGFLKSKEKYLFLFTRRSDDAGDGERYVVGYLTEKRCLHRTRRKEARVNRWWAAQGQIKLVSFENAFPLNRIVGKKSALRYVRFKKLDEKKTAQILRHFRRKENILAACLSEVERLKTQLKIEKGKERCK